MAIRPLFVAHFNSALMPAPTGATGGRGGGEAAPVLQWPEFNKLIGGYFKFHWSDPQLITVKIDDPMSPLTAMFHGREFEIHDETYTFAQDSFSRANVHVLTSIDYDKMSPADQAKERNPRTDSDYALSYIRREGRGRVFYEGHGHSERVYAITPMLEHIRAGIQYVLGDLRADVSPSKRARRTILKDDNTKIRNNAVNNSASGSRIPRRAPAPLRGTLARAPTSARPPGCLPMCPQEGELA
jgi:type 1 glutamine amidotransferase